MKKCDLRIRNVLMAEVVTADEYETLSLFLFYCPLALLYSERPKLYKMLAFLGALGLKKTCNMLC